jgi:hypothetical protein
MMATKKDKQQERSRSGYVMVHLNDEDRNKLESLQEKHNKKHGTNVGLAPIVRILIREANW